MSGLQLQWFVFSFVLFNANYGKKVCDFTNDECVTKGARNYYPTLLNAFKESPDPLYQEKIEQQIADFMYKLTNVTVVGIRKCIVAKLTCRPKEMTFDYYLRCPRLVLTADFETEGSIGSIPISGKGETKITADDYILAWKGGYGKFISKEDHKPRVFIKDFDVEVEPKGKITFEIINLFSGDKDKFDQANDYMNQNWMAVEKMSRQSIISGLFRKFFENFKEILSLFPLDDLLPGEEN